MFTPRTRLGFRWSTPDHDLSGRHGHLDAVWHRNPWRGDGDRFGRVGSARYRRRHARRPRRRPGRTQCERHRDGTRRGVRRRGTGPLARLGDRLPHALEWRVGKPIGTSLVVQMRRIDGSPPPVAPRAFATSRGSSTGCPLSLSWASARSSARRSRRDSATGSRTRGSPDRTGTPIRMSDTVPRRVYFGTGIVTRLLREEQQLSAQYRCSLREVPASTSNGSIHSRRVNLLYDRHWEPVRV